MNWLRTKLRDMQRNVMTDTTSTPNNDAAQSEVNVPQGSTIVLGDDQMQKLANMVSAQLQHLVQTLGEDVMKGNFSGAWDDVKKEAINAGIQDAVQVTRVLEQQVMEHLATLGTSKQLDVAKGKMTDAFMWLGKHLGIGG